MLNSEKKIHPDINFNDLLEGLDHSSILAMTDTKGVITFVNSKFCDLSKYSEEELVGKTHKIINSGHHSSQFFKDLWHTIASGEVWKGEICNRAKDGSIYWVDSTIVPLKEESGRIKAYLAIRHDITKQKNVEQQLKNTLHELSEQKMALDASNIVAITDASGVIEYVNDKFCEISKFSKDELIGNTHSLINSGFHNKQFFSDMWKTIASGQVWQGEVKNKAKDSSYYWVDTTIVPFCDEAGRPQKYIAIRKDITDKKQTEIEVEKQRATAVYSEKMASLGELTSGIAHELGNPLGAMRGRMEMLLFEAEKSNIEPEKVKDLMNRSIGLIDRMSKIIKGLRSYARDASGDPFVKTSINSLVSDILDFSWEKFRKLGVEVHVSGLDEEHLVECREAEIGQVIVNLINNACDAVKDENQRWVKVEVCSNSEKVFIQVTDSGPGIPDDLKEKILKPFFTTKPVGQGTGLGLSITKSILDAHQGQLCLDENSKNTKFVVELPKYRKD